MRMRIPSIYMPRPGLVTVRVARRARTHVRAQPYLQRRVSSRGPTRTEISYTYIPLKSSRNQSAKSEIKLLTSAHVRILFRRPPRTSVYFRRPPRTSVYFRGLQRKSEITKAEIRKSLGNPEI